MAVVAFNPWERPGGSVGMKGAADFSVTYLVETDSADDGPATILADVLCPSPGSTYSWGTESSAARCEKVSVRPLDNETKTSWLVQADYSAEAPEEEEGEENPFLRPWDITWRTEREEEVMDVDVDGTPVRNSAGQPFMDPVMRTKRIRRLTIVRNEARTKAGDELIDEYLDCVNSDKFWGKAPGTMLLDDHGTEEVTEGRYKYLKVTYEFLYKREGWNPKKVLDIGTLTIQPSGDEPEDPEYRQTILAQPTDDRGQAINEPVLLNGAGQQLGPTEAPVFLEFVGWEEKPFKKLKLDRR